MLSIEMFKETGVQVDFFTVDEANLSAQSDA